MDSYRNLAMDWLATQPDWATITSDPQTWALETGDRIFQRTRELTDQLAPRIPNEPFEERCHRLNGAWQTAEELAIAEHLSPAATVEGSEPGWVPLVPNLSDLL